IAAAVGVGRLAGYEDVNDAERLRHDPAMRWIVGGKAAQCSAASPSQMGRFETQWLAAPENLSALSDLSGQWIDLVHGRRPPRGIVLDMDSSVSPPTANRRTEVSELRCFLSNTERSSYSLRWGLALAPQAGCLARVRGGCKCGHIGGRPASVLVGTGSSCTMETPMALWAL